MEILRKISKFCETNRTLMPCDEWRENFLDFLLCSVFHFDDVTNTQQSRSNSALSQWIRNRQSLATHRIHPPVIQGQQQLFSVVIYLPSIKYDPHPQQRRRACGSGNGGGCGEGQGKVRRVVLPVGRPHSLGDRIYSRSVNTNLSS